MTHFTIGSSWQKDQITLSSIQAYFDQRSLDKLIFFVNDVVLNKQSKESDYVYKKVKEVFQKVLKHHEIKVIVPYRTLLLRMLDANSGFTDSHLHFLQICSDLKVPAEALPILQYPALFKTMNKTQTCNFVTLAGDLYCQLRNYGRALQMLTKATKLELSDTALVKVYPKITVLYISQGKVVPSEIRDGMKRITFQSEDTKILQQISEKEMKKFSSLVTFSNLNLYQWKKLTPQQETFLKSEDLLEPYSAGKWKTLGNYISKDVKMNNWRIKADSIKGSDVGSLEIAQGINREQQVYRYDVKERVMYFNHKKCDQNQLNDLITLAFNMQKEASECKIQKRELGGMGRDFRGMGGMGGMGGFGGMGGMGGMFGMGGMDSMGMGGSRRGGMGGHREYDDQ